VNKLERVRFFLIAILMLGLLWLFMVYCPQLFMLSSKSEDEEKPLEVISIPTLTLTPASTKTLTPTKTSTPTFTITLTFTESPTPVIEGYTTITMIPSPVYFIPPTPRPFIPPRIVSYDFIGNTGWLVGSVVGDYAGYDVFVEILVGKTWYPKPDWGGRSMIYPDGTFSIHMLNDGNDFQFIDKHIYLIPKLTY